MKGLFQCPPWARGFCPFRACGAKLAKVQLASTYSFNFRISSSGSSVAVAIGDFNIVASI